MERNNPECVGHGRRTQTEEVDAASQFHNDKVGHFTQTYMRMGIIIFFFFWNFQGRVVDS